MTAKTSARAEWPRSPAALASRLASSDIVLRAELREVALLRHEHDRHDRGHDEAQTGRDHELAPEWPLEHTSRGVLLFRAPVGVSAEQDPGGQYPRARRTTLRCRRTRFVPDAPWCIPLPVAVAHRLCQPPDDLRGEAQPEQREQRDPDRLLRHQAEGALAVGAVTRYPAFERNAQRQ